MPSVIVALGDSTTAGTPGFRSPVEAPPHGDGDPRSQYAWWLMDLHPDWRVINCGVNGERSDEIAARVDRDVLSREPQVVVVIAGVNDIYQGRSVEDVTTTLRGIYDSLLDAGILIVAGSILPFNTATGEQSVRMRAVNDWIRQQAERDPNVAFADTRTAVAAPGDPDRLADSPDHLHPGVEGYRRMAMALAPVIALQLDRRRRVASLRGSAT